MLELPKHISDKLQAKKTSLGDSPALPPSDEFINKLLSTYYEEISKPMDGKSVGEIVRELNETVVECQKEEQKKRKGCSTHLLV